MAEQFQDIRSYNLRHTAQYIENCSTGDMARVMIAEDSDAARMMLKDIVVTSGHNLIAEAKDGIEALEKIKSTKPEILLLDYNMPKKHGLDVLREMERTGATKVIMITVSDEQDVIQKCIMLGASAYLVKPFSSDMVIKAISYAIENN
jgi:two-component system chemotaxis response regulator CheY